MLKTLLTELGVFWGGEKKVQWNSTILTKCKAVIKIVYWNWLLSLFSSLQLHVTHITSYYCKISNDATASTCL